MDNDQKETNVMQVVIDPFAAVEKAVTDGDERQINIMMNEIVENVKILLKYANSDKTMLLVIKFLNKIGFTDSSIERVVFESFDASIETIIDDIELEKQTLLEVRKYIRRSKKTKKYDNLPLSFAMVIAVSVIQDIRMKNLRVKANIRNCGLKGIEYIPVEETNDGSSELRKTIELGIRELKKVPK